MYVCIFIGFCKKCIFYYNFALGYLHFAQNPLLEKFSFVKHNLEKKKVCGKSIVEIIFNPHFWTRKLQILYSYLILVASRLLRWEKPLRVAVDDIKHSGPSVVCGARKPPEILSSDFKSI